MSYLKVLVLHVLIAISLSNSAHAAIQDAYYPPELFQQMKAGAKDQQIKDTLNKIAKSQHANLGYDRARSFIFSEFYLVKINNGFIVKDVYCEKEYPIPGPQQGFPEGNLINVEHTWPQSKFTNNQPRDMQKADLHHLFPTDSVINSDRANYPFGEVGIDRKPLKCKSSRLGAATNDQQTVFEPPAAHKGNVARALFYFSVRYQVSIDSRQEAFLRKWDLDDPVDQEEMMRNDEIYKIQKNRNPFIDYPDLVKNISDF